MKLTLDRQRVVLYLWIALAWFFLWVFSYLVAEYDTFLVRIPNEIWRDLLLVPLNFILYEYIVPYTRKKRRFLIYNIVIGIFLAWIMLMLFSFGVHAWRALGIELGIFTPLMSPEDARDPVTYQFSNSVASMFFFGVITHIYDYNKLKRTAQQLKVEKKEAELNYLKSQTNPHFLFNTLNNIYSLARDKSDLAPESILRLSKILRFMLYETGGEYIAIEHELKIMNDYLALEKLRYDDSLRLNFNYNVEDMKQAVPPLLLIPLVENAFKHGVSETRGFPFVDIHLSVQKRLLVFLVKNSSENPETQQEVKENIGLSNLRRQLELLYTDYELTARQGDGVFSASLKINLTSHV